MDVISRTLTASNLTQLLVGVGAGAGAAILAGRGRHMPVAWWVPPAAIVAAFVATARWNDAEPYAAIDLAAAAVGIWVAWGAMVLQRTDRRPASLVGPLPAAIVLSLIGVWMAVPENGQVVLVLGVLAGLALAGLADGSSAGDVRPGPAVAVAFAAAIAVVVATGHAPTEVRYVGGLLCAGLLLWWPVLVARGGGVPTGGVGLVVAGLAHGAVVVLAARWVGASEGASSARAALVLAIGGLAAVVVRLVEWRRP